LKFQAVAEKTAKDARNMLVKGGMVFYFFKIEKVEMCEAEIKQ